MFDKKCKRKKFFFLLSVSPLTVQDRSDAENYVIKLVQQDYFGKLYDNIKSMNGDICFKVKKDVKIAFRPLKTLSVFCDSAGLLRSHSCIVNADKSYDTHFPIILPKRHNFVELLIRKVHYDLGHFGWSFVLARIQERFWILRGQLSVRSYLKN